MKISHEAYLRCLEPWAKSQEKYIYTVPQRPELACYGTGYNNWGAQTNQKGFAALAVLAADPDFSEKRAGISQKRVQDYALRILRFSLESHIEGSYHCMDGTKWGHTWISTLGIERMMHGVDAIESYLTPQDREQLRKVLLSECDWLLDHYKIEAGLYNCEGINRPESNLWNGSTLLRTAAMYPDASRKERYVEKGLRFLLNAISVPDDEFSQNIVDGKPVAERFLGANFFPSFALNHHGYLNVGYMVICLSNAAMLHFFYKKRGLKPPQALYHHLEELWELVKNCTFPDGRLLRIGGDTRARYCYCQDYAIPAWLLLADLKHDPAAVSFEASWLAQIQRELQANGDGSFLSQRVTEMSLTSPLYYTRLESDRAATISMGAYWRRVFSLPSEEKQPSPHVFSWSDDYHGACLERGKERIVSFVWEAAQPPQGLCLPTQDSDFAEWRYNLTGEILGLGALNQQDVVCHREKSFPGGFLTWGRTEFQSLRMSAERQAGTSVAKGQLVFAALPDDATVIVLQRAVVPDARVYVSSCKGVFLQIPNDIYNGNRRTYFARQGKLELRGFGSAKEVLNLESSWLNIEDKLALIGLYGVSSFFIYRPGRRQIGLAPHPDFVNVDNSNTGGQLFADEICYPVELGLQSLDPGQEIYDLAVLLQTGANHQETQSRARSGSARITFENPLFKAVRIAGRDGRTYLLLANFSGETVTLRSELPAEKGFDLAAGQSVAFKGMKVAPDSARLFRLD